MAESHSTASPTCVLLFAKHPTPGQVNTRLCPPLTPQQAATVHESCIRYLCQSPLIPREARRILVVTPDDAAPSFHALAGPSWEIRPQGDGDLGERLERWVRKAFEEGAARVVCIGADSPTMPADSIAESLRQLSHGDIVLGPCEDGGVYLIGLSRRQAGIFDGIEWGTDHVAEGLLQRARAAGLRSIELPLWYDIDRFDDLERAIRDLSCSQDDPASLLLYQELTRLVSLTGS